MGLDIQTRPAAVNVNVVVMAWQCMILSRQDAQGFVTESGVEARRDLSVLPSFLPVVSYYV